jgi:hypothetical protein
MKCLGGTTGEVFNVTAQRLVHYGCSEAQAYRLAQVCTLAGDATDAACEDEVILALVAASEAANGRAEVTYVSGIRRDVLREATLRLDATRREGR